MKKLLIVDDDRVLLTVLGKMFSNLGDFTVTKAENGQEAIDQLAAGQFDLVLTDLNMPVMNGFHLLAYLLKNNPDLPVIVMTTYDTTELAQRIKGFGSLSFVQKPVERQIVDLVQQQLAPSAKGFIQGITLFSFVQLLNLEKKTCVLWVSKGQQIGKLFFTQGELTHAILGTKTGEEAAYDILSWDNVQIDIRDSVRAQEATIKAPISHMLMEAVRLKDERRMAD